MKKQNGKNKKIICLNKRLLYKIYGREQTVCTCARGGGVEALKGNSEEDIVEAY